MSQLLTLTDQTFDEQLAAASAQTVLVDFWAPWCGPCRMLAPVLEEIAKEKAGQAVIAKVDVDQNPQLTQRFGIRALPTMVIFRNGSPVEELHGVQNKTVLLGKLAA